MKNEIKIIVGTATLGLFAFSTTTTALDFTSTGSGLWNAGNWDTVGTPNVNSGTDNATIAAGHTVTVNPTVDPGPGDFTIRNNNTVTVQDGGTLTHNTGNWFRMAQNSDGTLNIEGGTVTRGSAGNLAWGINGGTANIVIGDGIGAPGSAILQRNGGILSLGMNRDGGAGFGVMTINSDGIYTASSGDTFIGENSGATATLTMNDGAQFVQGGNDLHFGRRGNATVVTHGNASINHTPANWVWIGRASGTSSVTMNDDSTFFSNANRFLIGDGSGNGTLTLNDNASVDANGKEVWVASRGGSPTGTVNIRDNSSLSAGLVYVGTTGTGTVNLEGGTLRVNSIDMGDASDTFNWGGGTLTTRAVGLNATPDLGDVSSAGFNEVKLGTSIDIDTNLSTGYLGGSSTLDLNSLYINSGVRFDQLAVTGSLDLSAAGDTLSMTINPYLLRPNIGLALDSGEIPLVTASGGITGEFDTAPTFLQDVIGWSEYTGTWIVGSSTAAVTLGKNEYFLEYDSAGAITLFYKVEGTVPEPGTMGLLAIGLLIARGMRERGRRSA